MTLTVEELRAIDLFDGVGDEQVARWAEAATDQWLEPGEPVVCIGRRA